MAILALLNGCTSVVQSVMPEHRLVVMINTDNVLNPNENGRPSPLSVSFYQLQEKGAEAFMKAEFFPLYDTPSATLGTDLLNVSKLDLTPNTESRLTLPLKHETKYVGVVAAYHDVEGTQWRLLIPLDSNWGREKIRLGFSQYGVEQISLTQSGINYQPTSLKKPTLDYDINGPDSKMRYEILSRNAKGKS